MTDEQKLELKNIYINYKNSKDQESRKLYIALFKTLNIDIKSNYIKTINIFRDYTNKKLEFWYPDIRRIEDLPITVISYLLTKDDIYLKIGKYCKTEYKGHECIYTSCFGYCIDRIYSCQKEAYYDKYN